MTHFFSKCSQGGQQRPTDSSSCLQVATLGMRIYGKHGNASRMTASIAGAMHRGADYEMRLIKRRDLSQRYSLVMFCVLTQFWDAGVRTRTRRRRAAAQEVFGGSGPWTAVTEFRKYFDMQLAMCVG